jgi:hypothetical protein
MDIYLFKKNGHGHLPTISCVVMVNHGYITTVYPSLFNAFCFKGLTLLIGGEIVLEAGS